MQNFKKYTKTNYFYLELVFKISLQSSITLNQNYTSKSGGSGNEVWTLTWKSFQEPESAFGLHHLVDEPEGAALRERSWDAGREETDQQEGEEQGQGDLHDYLEWGKNPDLRAGLIIRAGLTLGSEARTQKLGSN